LNDETRRGSLHRVILAYGVLTALCLFLLGRLDAPLTYYGAKRAADLLGGGDPLRALLWGLGAGGAMALLGEVFTRTTDWGRSISRALRHMVGRLHPLDALLLAVLSAAGEELLFRGIAQPYLGLFFASTAFGAVHFVPRKGLWPWALWALGAGFAFGWLAKAAGGLLAPAVAHLIVNFIGLLTLGRRRL
jgi:membrane protease YdiL (CAAX protease family)